MTARVVLSICLAASAWLGPALASEDGEAPFGVWLTDDGGSKVEIFRCGDAACGRVAWLRRDRDDNGNLLTDSNNPNPQLRSVPLVGLVVMSGIKPSDKPSRWAGEVYNPEDGRTYDFTLTVKSESTIIIQGCGLYGLICQKHEWTRVEP